jgi:hypothetical protein
MSRPRVFVSSTYYELKAIRADLERFMRDRSFEPVLHERGHVPYGAEQKLEEYCYKEIEHCDILVSIVGGRYGSPSKEPNYSISQLELKTAIEQGKQVYVFVEKAVLAEHRTFDKNRENKTFVPAAVDDLRVYKFLDEVVGLPMNNQIAPFETSSDITGYLQEQWSGLFQRLLEDSARQKEVLLLEDMKEMTTTLKQLVSFLASEKTKGDQAIKDILLVNHPIFTQIRKTMRIPYRVFFTNLDELVAWITNRGFTNVDIPDRDDPEFLEWMIVKDKKLTLLKVKQTVFDEDGRLRIFTPADWKEAWVALETRPVDQTTDDDNIPF